MNSPIHTLSVNVFGRVSHVAASPAITADRATEALYQARRLLVYTVYMYTEVARSYSRDVGDYLKRNGLFRGCTRKYLALVQRKLDETLRLMHENTVADVFIDYSDTFYFSLQPQFAYLRQCLDHELERNGIKAHEALAYTYTLHNLVNFAVDSHHSLISRLRELYGIDFSRPFRQWKPDGAERWCRELNESLYGREGNRMVSEDSIEHKQTVYAFNSLVDAITNYDTMKKAAQEVVAEYAPDTPIDPSRLP